MLTFYVKEKTLGIFGHILSPSYFVGVEFLLCHNIRDMISTVVTSLSTELKEVQRELLGFF